MKQTTATAKTSSLYKDRYKDDTETDRKDRGYEPVDKPLPDLRPDLPPEMAGRADARELREFMQHYLSIDDKGLRQRIVNEVKLASQQDN